MLEIKRWEDGEGFEYQRLVYSYYKPNEKTFDLEGWYFMGITGHPEEEVILKRKKRG